MLKILIRLLLIIVILAIALELTLRIQFGFCSSPLYVADPDYEYIYAPNQNVTRFGNVIKTNSLSMRNDELSTDSTINILLVGDSVVNGGSLTDQDSIASTILEKKLRKNIDDKIRVLNIAAGSWGPDNVAGYLKKHGLFNAKLIFLVTSSHDAHDIMTGGEGLIGVDPGWPSKQFKLALVELWVRYRGLIAYSINERLFVPIENLATKYSLSDKPQPTIVQPDLNSQGIEKEGVIFNPGFAALDSLATAHGVPFSIYLHPETSEVAAGKFNQQGMEIIKFCEEHHIKLYNEFDLGVNLSLFREMDVVHYNNKGQKFLATNIYPIFLDYLNHKN